MRDKANDSARLELMLEALTNIEAFLTDITDYNQFVGNKMLCHAVIYNLQCIGESGYMLTKEYKDLHPVVKWKAIEGLRHVLVHDYYQVELETIWSIIQNDLNPLQLFLQSEVKDS